MFKHCVFSSIQSRFGLNMQPVLIFKRWFRSKNSNLKSHIDPIRSISSLLGENVKKLEMWILSQDSGSCSFPFVLNKNTLWVCHCFSFLWCPRVGVSGGVCVCRLQWCSRPCLSKVTSESRGLSWRCSTLLMASGDIDRPSAGSFQRSRQAGWDFDMTYCASQHKP